MIKIIFNTRLLLLICLITAVGFVSSSCKKDKNANSGKVELLSFGPTGAMHGDTLVFIGMNLDKVTSIQFTGGTGAAVDQGVFTAKTSELIKLIVPQAAEKGFVTLKTPDGDIVTKTILNLNVLTTVTSITAQARPGENITINGNFLNWVGRITFAKDKIVETFVSKTKTQIVVTVPADAETGPLVLSYGGTDSADVQTADTLKVTLPLVTSMAPMPVKPLTNVTITGTNLDLAKKVIFTGVATPVTVFVSQSATQLVVRVPETAKKGKIILEAASGVKTTTSGDLDIVLPLVTTFSPALINLGANITITGTDLDLVKKVIFSGVAAPVTVFITQTATQLVVKVPAGSRMGKIKLETASAVQTTSGSDLDVILPVVTSLSPNPVFPATPLTISGTRLDMVTSVAFENAPAVTSASFTSQSASQIVVTVPTGVLSGKITLGLSNPADTVKSSESLVISGGTPPPTIALPIYDDAVTSNWSGSGGWIGGGWGGTADYNNTTPVRAGTKSVKITYTGQWSSPLQLGHNAGFGLTLAPYTTFKISIYGAPGSGGKKISIGVNGVDGQNITIVEGVWTDYSFPISAVTSASSIGELILKEYTGGTFGGFTIYVDAIGLN
ncbi:MAG: IPT/TIG domain-containing protein [Lacibacter sp.]